MTDIKTGIKKTLTPFLIILMLLFLVTFLIFTASTALGSDPSVIITMGKSPIKEDISRAKQNAVNDALNEAMENAVAQLLTPSELSDSFAFICSTLLNSGVEAYIITYKIIGETQQASVYNVAVETRLNINGLEQFFKEKSVITTDIPLPSVMLFISEKRPGDILPRYWWGNNPLPYDSVTEQKIISMLREQNFQIIGHGAGDGAERPDPEASGVFFTAIHDMEASVSFGRKLQADIVIAGTAWTEEDANIMGDEKTYRGMVELDLFSTASGLKLAALSKNAVAKSVDSEEGLNNSLVKAGEIAAEALAALLKSTWAEQGTNFKIIKAKIEGSDYLSSFIMLRKTLGTMNNIKDVQTRELSSEQAIVDISFKGNGTTLANALMLKTFGNFGLELSEVTDESLTIRFIPKANVPPIEKSDIEGAYISE